MMPLMITSRVVEPSERQRSCMDDIQFIIQKHDSLSTMERVALCAQLLGMLIAGSPPAFSPALLAKIVQDNIEIGNAAAIAALRDAEPAGNG